MVVTREAVQLDEAVVGVGAGLARAGARRGRNAQRGVDFMVASGIEQYTLDANER